MNTDCTPRCPWCNTARHVSSSNTTLRAWYCGKCKREFEAEDDGDISYGRPERRMERQEREAERRARQQAERDQQLRMRSNRHAYRR